MNILEAIEYLKKGRTIIGDDGTIVNDKFYEFDVPEISQGWTVKPVINDIVTKCAKIHVLDPLNYWHKYETIITSDMESFLRYNVTDTTGEETYKENELTSKTVTLLEPTTIKLITKNAFHILQECNKITLDINTNLTFYDSVGKSVEYKIQDIELIIINYDRI